MSSDKPAVTDNPKTHEVVDEALQSLWDVANNLARIRSPKEAYRVTIFGSARIAPGQALYADVQRLAERLSRMGCDIVTGGGPGLMQAANEGAQLGDPDDVRRSIGVRVHLPFEDQANPFVEKVYNHQTFFSRLHQFVRLSDAFVIVGGGIGTTLELFMVWQLLQVQHLSDVPLVLVGDMWRKLVDWAAASMGEHQPPFASKEDFHIPTCVRDVDEALALLKPHVEAFVPASRRGT